MQIGRRIQISPTSRDYSLVVAIDFGTTRSGYVYSFIPKNANDLSVSDLHNFTAWRLVHKQQDIPNYAKTLTQLFYEGNTATEWGWGAKFLNTFKKGTLVKDFKLLLQERFQPVNIENRFIPISDVVATYLKYLKDCALNQILKSAPENISPNSILWCLTIPAMWNAQEVDLMRQAAIKAGMVTNLDKDSRLIFVSEPEAAAVHCYLNQLTEELKEGDTFMVIDAGGGTVDIASYRVSGNPSLEELALSSSGKHGSILLDHNFLMYLISMDINAESLIEDKRVIDLLMEWENVKHSIEDLTKNYYFKIPDQDDYYTDMQAAFLENLRRNQGGRDDELVLTPDILNKIFDPDENLISQEKYKSVLKGVSQDVQAHVDSLGKKGIKQLDYIFLVGGFNNSVVLSKHLISSFKSVARNNEKSFIVPRRPEQAIMEGACIYALNPSLINARISKYTYGVQSYAKYDPRIHKGREKTVLNGEEYCKGVFSIFCRQNDAIVFNHAIPMTVVPANDGQESIILKVYYSKNQNPQFIDDEGVNTLGSLEIPLEGQGIDREVLVQFYFGEADLTIKAQNASDGRIVNVSFDLKQD